MPGADAKTEEDVAPFEVDMNFDNTEEEVEEAQEEETTEAEPVAEETTEEVAEEQVEEPVAQEAESPEANRGSKRAYQQMMSNLWKQWRKMNQK